jgi:trans-aconitate 2-methyltransferase
MDSSWNPNQYHRFQRERQQPFFDLLELVRPHPAMRVVDLGCGTGELTRILHERLEASSTLGIDSSDAMLQQAAQHAGGSLRFARGEVKDFDATAQYDLVFSNAALHWLDDHPALFRRLRAALAERGQLAVQMPANFDHPSHTVAEAVAGEEPFRAALGDYRRGATPVAPPEVYSALLDELGFSAQHVRLQVYPHRLASSEDVVEWVKGSLLTAYQSRLPADLFAPFVARYRECLLERIGRRRPYLYTFKRVLMWGMVDAEEVGG